jgi:hypothetical protein
VWCLPALAANPSLPDALTRAKAGDAGSQDIVGMMYMFGQGTRQNLPEAARWLEKSTAGGLPQAQVALAALADVGQGVPLDTERAQHLRQQAADAGNPTARGQLEALRKLPGQAEFMRAQVLVDLKMPTLAIPHAQWAADQGNAGARFLMGWFNHGGNGMPVDFAAARAYCQKAAGQGYVQAMRGLAYMNEFGQGGQGRPQDRTGLLRQGGRWRQRARQARSRQSGARQTTTPGPRPAVVVAPARCPA